MLNISNVNVFTTLLQCYQYIKQTAVIVFISVILVFFTNKEIVKNMNKIQ